MPAICKYQETIKEIEMTEGNTDTINDRNSLTQDDERQHDIILRSISVIDDASRKYELLFSGEIIRQTTFVMEDVHTLGNVICLKRNAEKLLEIACKGAYATICEGRTDDHDYLSKSMMDLIMIIIREYGGAISSKTLDKLFGNSDEYLQAIGSMIGLGMVKYATQVNGKVIGFYIPVD